MIWLAALALVCALAFPSNGLGGDWMPAKARRVMTWVPPYAVEACKQRLDESFDGIGMKDGLTHMGLQFWNPTREGGLKLVEKYKEKGGNETAISDFQQWGKTHGVKILLCIYNGTPSGWDWDLARSAFATNRAEFVEALANECGRLKLDGVDIDFEGKGKSDDDQELFVQFIKELSERLHAEGRELTIDSFAYKWNAPNQEWWPALLPHVDGLHVMGYAQTGAGAARWRSYQFIKAAAGQHASKLLIGMPSHAAEWQNNSALEHLQWIRNDESVGLAIWEARLRDPSWRTKPVWEAIAKIKAGAEQAPEARKPNRPEPRLGEQ